MPCASYNQDPTLPDANTKIFETFKKRHFLRHRAFMKMLPGTSALLTEEALTSSQREITLRLNRLKQPDIT
ncbi:hypothetical protein PoB_005714900 [Plakobranchus ocellatus]|uniref:Uncharacterized protein n=1 Tax=Plakobranchus ocellatus TaxID=259542 RepID=A0AAV4CIJ8_9GAST|nr:hypothetical protein PoB_005714900 [Plakobranchus ocellatus]